MKLCFEKQIITYKILPAIKASFILSVFTDRNEVSMNRSLNNSCNHGDVANFQLAPSFKQLEV